MISTHMLTCQQREVYILKDVVILNESMQLFCCEIVNIFIQIIKIKIQFQTHGEPFGSYERKQ